MTSIAPNTTSSSSSSFGGGGGGKVVVPSIEQYLQMMGLPTSPLPLPTIDNLYYLQRYCNSISNILPFIDII
jgi:hypothetical protein